MTAKWIQENLFGGCFVKKIKKMKKENRENLPSGMQKGYYDCSSLVWRSYKKSGKLFGNKTYAPVAADMVKWCSKNQRMIKEGLCSENVSQRKLRPGDIMFETGDDNHWYKGIYHVEMFVGYRCDSMWGMGKDQVSLSALWAARPANYCDNEISNGKTIKERPRELVEEFSGAS